MKLVLILSSVLLNCAAQLLIRKGMLQIGALDFTNIAKQLSAMLSNMWLWGAVVSMGASLMLWFAVLSKVEVSYALPFNAIGYIVIAIAGYCLFNEQVSFSRIVGILIICVGLFFVARS